MENKTTYAAILIAVFISNALVWCRPEIVPPLEREARAADKLIPRIEHLAISNDGFRNLTEYGIPHKRVVGILSAASVGFDMLKGIASQVDLSRVCVIGFSNMGNRKFIDPVWYLDYGIIREPLPIEVLPGDAGVFTFEKSRYGLAGTAGVFTYTLEGTRHKIVVMWTVPELYGIYSNEFNVHVLDDVTASDDLYDMMRKDEQKVEVWDGGHWLTRNVGGIQVHAAMTNNAKATYIVKVEYNLTSTLIGPVIG